LSGGLFFFLLFSRHTLDQEADGAFAFFGFADFGAGGEDAEGGVEGDLFYACCLWRCFSGGWVFGEVEAGDLEAVEEEAGAARVDVVGGDALQDFADGGLDRGAVFGEGQVEGGAAAAALARVGDGFTGGVVVVAELLLAETGAGAAAAVGEDVAALVLLWCFVGVGHVPSPRGTSVQSLRRTGDRSGLPGSRFAVKGEGPAFGRASFFFLFLF
jgi:hypothetical protein